MSSRPILIKWHKYLISTLEMEEDYVLKQLNQQDFLNQVYFGTLGKNISL